MSRGIAEHYLEKIVASYRALWEARGLKPVFEAIADAVAAAFHVPPPDLPVDQHPPIVEYEGCAVCVWIWDAAREEMVLAAARNEPVAYVADDYAMGCDEGLDGPLPVTHAVMLAGEQRWYEDIHREQWYEDTYRDQSRETSPKLYTSGYCAHQGFKSLVATPIAVPKGRTEPVGIIDVFFRESVSAAAYELESLVLRVLAHQASFAIESELSRRRLMTENALRQQANLCLSADAFLDQAVRIVADVFDSEGCDIYAATADGNGLNLVAHNVETGAPTHYELGKGLTGATAKLRRVLRVNQVGDAKELERLSRVLDADMPLDWSQACPFREHTDRATTQYMGAPLLLHGDDGPVGVLRVRRKRDEAPNWHRYMPMDEELLLCLADVITESVEHYRSVELLLKDMAHRHAGDLRSLSEVRVGADLLQDARDMSRYDQEALGRALREVQIWLAGTRGVNEALDLRLPHFRNLGDRQGVADLGATLEDLARSRFDAFSPRFEAKHEMQRGIIMDRRLVTYCAIVWNEIIGNIIKHGKPDASGVVRATLSLFGRADGRLELTAVNLTERDVGVTFPGEMSGRAIVVELVEEFLDGVVEFEYNPQSREFTCRLLLDQPERSDAR